MAKSDYPFFPVKEIKSKKSSGTKTAQSVDQLKIRLNQMLYDRNLSRKGGLDTKGGGYAPNAEIDKLRKLIKESS